MPTWNSKLTIGIPSIDAQHQELGARADALLAALRADRPEAELDRLFWYVDDYASSHFAAEEELMRRVSYPEAKLHADLHHAFTAEFEELVERFRRHGPSQELTAFLEALFVESLVDHVRTSDVRIAEFVRARPPPPPARLEQALRPA